MKRRAHLVLSVLLALLAVSSAAFVVDTDATPDPVPFEDTIKLGMTGTESTRARTAGYAVPRAEVFYSGYRYVVGYRTIGSLVAERQRAGHDRQFGRPLATYVTDFSGTDPTLTPEGYVELGSDVDRWVPASAARFVVDSPARTTAGPAVLPFSDPGDAEAFADRYGGEVRGWATVRSTEFDAVGVLRERMRGAVAERSAWADRTVADARRLLDRPVSVVVGRDAPTLRAAVERAPPNTTVRVPAGTYEANLTVGKPLTIRGAGPGTHLRGDGEGSVVGVRSPDVAVADLRITGVGNVTSPEEVPVNESGWDYAVQLGYAYGDAGIEFERANGSYVRDVVVDTPANGVLLRYSDRAVVENLTVYGGPTWREGFMGVMDMASRIVVQDSTFVGGRDGVYTHLADGIVVRDSEMRDLRFGVHEMYTDDALLSNNTVHNAEVGLIVMTDPDGNALVDNDVRGSRSGVSVSGGESYVARNVVADNRFGLVLLSDQSLYEYNAVVRNEVGLRSSQLLPTDTVVANDVVANDRPARASLGPLRVWSGADGGNFWGSAPGVDADGDGTIDRAYRPTGTVDAMAGRVAGADGLARSPAVAAQRTVRSLVPGLRSTGVVDDRPLARPVRPDVLSRLNVTVPGGETG
jgi:nitrous oxidase accessory protein NosD/nitrous oxide reductase accessory protein NosL